MINCSAGSGIVWTESVGERQQPLIISPFVGRSSRVVLLRAHRNHLRTVKWFMLAEDEWRGEVLNCSPSSLGLANLPPPSSLSSTIVVVGLCRKKERKKCRSRFFRVL